MKRCGMGWDYKSKSDSAVKYGKGRNRRISFKPANADTENARDKDSPWRFRNYCCFSVFHPYLLLLVFGKYLVTIMVLYVIIKHRILL